jgi:lambda repressor-like predicted transcriptional regulator
VSAGTLRAGPEPITAGRAGAAAQANIQNLSKMTSQSYRPFLKALYPVGALLILTAVSEPAMQIWPFRFGEVRWRFGAVGLMSGAVVGALFGLVWIMAVAAMLDHRKTLRTVSVVCGVIGLVLTAVAFAFALDFLQVRNSVNPNYRGALDMTVLRAMAVLGLSIPAALGLGIGGWRSTRVSGRPHAGKAARDVGLVFQTQPQGGNPA